ncbi:MAG: Hsp20/alpha crystallin family protein [Burkholderiaceae bacterium]
MYVTFNRTSRARPASQALNGAVAIDQLFDGFFHRPAASTVDGAGSTIAARFDVVEKDDRFEARIEIPGVDKDDIDVQIDGASVRVKAEVKTVDAAAEGTKLLHSNRLTRSWLRNFTLPSEVDEARADAAYQDGVLTLTLPKKTVVQPKRLAIK